MVMTSTFISNVNSFLGLQAFISTYILVNSIEMTKKQLTVNMYYNPMGPNAAEPALLKFFPSQ